MANLIGYIDYFHHAGTVHRLAHKQIRSRLNTWQGGIVTDLDKDGNAVVTVNGKVVWQGNVNKK